MILQLQDPSRHFLTYEECRYLFTIQRSGRLFCLHRAEIFIFHHDWAEIFLGNYAGGDIYFQKIPAPPPPESELVAPL